VTDGEGAAPSGMAISESAATYAWLEKSLSIAGNSSGLFSRLWADIRDRMRRRNAASQDFVYATDWVSDYWIASGVKQNILPTFGLGWRPPDGLSAWPSFDIERLMGPELPGSAARTAYSPPPPPAGSNLAGTADSAAAALQFSSIESEIKRHADPIMIYGEHVRAWLQCAVGNYLKGLLFSPDEDDEFLKAATFARLSTSLSIQIPPEWAPANEFEEKTLEVLYNLWIEGDGRLIVPDLPNTRVGQGERWRESWDWLSQDAEFSLVRNAVRMAARMMRRNAVVQGLIEAARSADSRLPVIALAVVRRWLLTLRAMHWLEEAADSSWRDIRAQDLSCFAFSALKPEWPRRVLALSHRSVDAKPALQATGLWWSGLCALDASYVPAWETNTGMVWSLFGACPAIVRVASPRYTDSIWCRRESELSQYLHDRSDFMEGRWLIDVPLQDVPALERAFATWRSSSLGIPPPEQLLGALSREFPPMVQVWTPTPLPAWETTMLRAAAALRTINAFTGDAAATNRFAEFLLRGSLPPLNLPAPTNNPDGWRAYVTIFQDLVNACRLDPGELPIRLPDDYTAEASQIDADLGARLPEFSSGAHALSDCLVAREFFRTEWQVIATETRGRFLMINCREIERDQWLHAEQLSLHRGLLSFRTPVPVWIIQAARQDVERWGLPGDHPIFTEYLPDQFSWMLEIFLDRAEAQARFPADSGLWFSPALRAICEAGGPGGE